MRSLLVGLALFLISFSAKADLDYARLQQSVYKVYKMNAKEEPHMVASSFAVNYGNATYLITNNHVCFGLAGPGKAYIKVNNGPSEKYTNPADYDQIVQVSPLEGSDVCVIRTKNQHPGLNFAWSPLKIHQPVTAFGYIGRSDYIMISHGYMYGTLDVMDYDGFRDCQAYPPKFTKDKIICIVYSKYPIFKKNYLATANVNVGPGYSGSPVLDVNGDIVGITARYMPPSSIYGNGDGMFYDDSFIINAITTANFIPVTSPELYEDSKLIDYVNGASEFFESLKIMLMGRGYDDDDDD